MAHWTIENTISGQRVGAYEGDSATDALDAMARSVGFKNMEDAGRVVRFKPDELRIVSNDHEDEDESVRYYPDYGTPLDLFGVTR